MLLKFIQVVTCVNSSLLFIAEEHFALQMYNDLFIYFPVEGYLECFQFLAFMNKSVYDILEQVL